MRSNFVLQATKKDIHPTKLKEYLIQKTSDDRQSG